MNENRHERNERMEMDAARLLGVLWQKKLLIAVVAMLLALVTFAGTWFLIAPKYQSTAMFYVNNYSKLGESAGSITSSDITASKNLVDSYIVILNTRSSLEDVISTAGVSLTCEELEEMLDASAVNSTEIFQVVVTSTDRDEALKIAEAITVVLPQRISSILEGTSANVVDVPVRATNASSPNYVINTVAGFALGLVLSMVAIVLQQFFDVTIRAEEDITRMYDLPILASVPDMEVPAKGGYYSNKLEAKTAEQNRSSSQVGDKIPFAASEAFKLLRTKVQFSFADDNDCHVIGVSSAMAGEGKSTTAANLAFALAQLNNRVLLMDCDLRRPSIPVKLPVEKIPGLTNFLTRQVSFQEIVQTCELDDVKFSVIAAGSVPPNPIELLSSDRMDKAMTVLKKSFDYIVMDLPPVGEVSDALVAAKMTDGILLVVRQNYCNRRSLEDTVRQFEFVDARILGVLVCCASDNKMGYKRYYKRGYGSYKKARYGLYDKTRK